MDLDFTASGIQAYIDGFNVTSPFKVGYVLKLLLLYKISEVIDLLASHAQIERPNVPRLTSKLYKLRDEFKRRKRDNFKRESARVALRAFFNEDFFVSYESATELNKIHAQDPGSSSMSRPAIPEDSNHSPVQTPSHCEPILTPVSAPLMTSTPLSTRRDCEKCASLRAQYESEKHALLVKLKDYKDTIASLKGAYDVRCVNQFRKRKADQIEDKKDKIKVLQHENDALQKELDGLKKKLVVESEKNKDVQLEKLQKTILKEKKQHEAARQKIKVLEKEIKELKAPRDLSSLSSDSSGTIQTRQDEKQYSYKMRKCIFNCLSNQVPVDCVGEVLKYSFETMTGQQLSHIPLPSTAAQMTIEMSVLSDLQVAEAVLAAPCINLAWDATTLEGRHLNEIHFNTPDCSYTLTTQQLPGGTAADYAQQINDSIVELSTLHAEFNEMDSKLVELQVKSRILSTMTDRAAANHATVVLLQEKCQLSLLELNCHMHPLDGLANSARSSLKELDRQAGVSGATFGRDCCVANLMYGVSKLRYKAKGDPSGFKSFLKARNVACSAFIRYVGNRLHVLFHLAGTIILYKSLLEEYLQSYCAATALGSAVLKDLRNDHILTQAYALAWMGKLVTGPWMTLMYTPMAERNHFELADCIKSCIEKLTVMEEYPEMVVLSSEDIFNKPLVDGDPVIDSLRGDDQRPDLLKTIGVLLSGFKTVLTRQLCKYISGPLASPSDAMRTQAMAAPSHNIWAERCLGMVDNAFRRAPNATMAFIDGKVKFKTNKTLAWLDTKTPPQQEALVSFVVKQAAHKRKREKERMEKVESELRERMLERGQKKSMAERKRLGKVVKAAFDKGGVGLQDEVFKNVGGEALEVLSDILENNGTRVIGRRLHHIWNLDNADTIYNGRISKISQKTNNIWISYWTQHGEEEEAEDFKITLVDFAADIVGRDLLFL